MLIRNKFDSKCAVCTEIAWAGEQVYYNSHAESGKKIRHEKCGDFATYREPEAAAVAEEESAPVETKTCTRCDREKSLSEFGIHRGARDGLQYWCRDCTREGAKESRARQQKKRVLNLPGEKPFTTGEAAELLSLPVETIRAMTYGDVVDLVNAQRRLERLRTEVAS